MTDTHKQMIEDYHNGLGTTKIATKYGFHRSTVQAMLIRNGVELRKTSPHRTYNVHFFSEYTRESCYWAGFILADGYIRSERDAISIKLGIRDDTHLMKFIKCIEYTGEVHYDSDQRYCYVDICGQWFKRDLINRFDITPRKSKTAVISDKIPVELYPDFIRGIIDGDGSITYYKTKNKTNLALSICGTESVLTSIAKFFHDHFSIIMKTDSQLPSIVTHPGMYTISYGMKNSDKILTRLYSYANELLYLDRKRNRWLELRED